MSGLVNPMIANFGAQEILLILLVLVLLFGAKKLPELARGSGRALRIFKSETKGLMDEDEKESTKTEEQRYLDAQQTRSEQYRPEASGERRPETDR